MKCFVFVYCMIIVLTSCKFQHRINNNDFSSDSIVNKTIIFPNSLVRLENIEFQELDESISEIENKRKIISIIDGNCMKCVVNHLNRIDSIFNSILIDDDAALIFILNVSKMDSAFFMRNLQSSINASGVILWDSNFYFERQNDLFTPNINLRTFMTNKKNEIVLYGNPILNPDVIFEYQAELDEITAK